MGWLRRSIPHMAVVIWLAAATFGSLLLIDYGLKAGAPGTPPRLWPSAATFERSADSATLVMLAHPHCPCTMASLQELEVIMTRCRGRLKAYVLFIRPDGAGEDWTHTKLWTIAGSMPGVTTILDDGSVEAARFGATTSGQVLIYDADGRLLFAGGITPSRGESGDNAGLDSILSLLQSQPPPANETPVYGCPLFNRPRHAEM